LATTPHIFENRQDLISELARHKDTLAAWFHQRVELSRIIPSYVGNDTFRALRHPQRPSVVIGSWTNTLLGDGKLTTIFTNVNTPGEYDAWSEQTANDLSSYWLDTGPSKPLTYGQSRKIISLLTKSLLISDALSEDTRQRLLTFAHVPWDHWTLVPLRNIAAQSELRAEIGPIPKAARIGSVTTAQQYNVLLALIRDLAQEAGVPPIYYEVLAWDVAHGYSAKS